MDPMPSGGDAGRFTAKTQRAGPCLFASSRLCGSPDLSDAPHAKRRRHACKVGAPPRGRPLAAPMVAAKGDHIGSSLLRDVESERCTPCPAEIAGLAGVTSIRARGPTRESEIQGYRVLRKKL